MIHYRPPKGTVKEPDRKWGMKEKRWKKTLLHLSDRAPARRFPKWAGDGSPRDGHTQTHSSTCRWSAKLRCLLETECTWGVANGLGSEGKAARQGSETQSAEGAHHRTAQGKVHNSARGGGRGGGQVRVSSKLAPVSFNWTLLNLSFLFCKVGMPILTGRDAAA